MNATPRTWRTGVVLGLAGWAFGIALGQLGATRVADAALYDAATQSAASIPADERVARVYVSEGDVAAFSDEFGRWPWRSRRPHAVALDILRESGAAAVGYDMFFAEPALDDSDVDLMISIAEFEHVVHGCLLETDGNERVDLAALSDLAEATLANAGVASNVDAADVRLGGRMIAMPIDPLLEGSSLLGHCNPSADSDRSIRRAPLFARHGDQILPSLSLRLAMLMLDVAPDDVKFDPDAREVRLTSGAGDTIRIPVDPDGALWVHYDRPRDEIVGYRYLDLDLPEVREGLAGRAVVLGVSISAAADLWRTPMGEQYPGFLIHAQVLENLLAGRAIRAVQVDRYPFGARERLVHLLLLLGCAGLGVVASRVDVRWAWTTTFAAAALPIAVGWLALAQGDVWITPTTSAVALGGAGFLGVGYRQVLDARERRRVRAVYERYLSPAVLDAVLSDPSLLQLGGARKELSIFFSDIRGFTAFSESVEPEELTARLNEYYGEMIAIAHRFEATVDKLMGDGLMVFFGDPVPQPDHGSRAIRMALAMQSRLAELRSVWEDRDVHPFESGMGIATGHVAVGNLGSDGFVDYTVVGRSVNVAARLEHAAAAGEVLIDEPTYQSARDEIEAERLGPRDLKGITRTVTVYRVTGLRSTS